jgi:TPP-dependent indolepyruvate ferredoxin oxidoreductase alpha subunit
MAKFSSEARQTLWRLKDQLLDLIDEAKALELLLFERFGETNETIIVLDELKDIAEQAASRFSQLSTLQLRLAESQPSVLPDMMELLVQTIANTQQRVPALERSVEEIKVEWS